MRIGIDARLWGTQHAGIGRYVEELVKNLREVDKKNSYVLFCRRKDIKKIPARRKWKKVVADVPHYTVREQIALPFIFAREKLDLLHVPHFNVPIPYLGPFVVTIHDVLWHDVRGLRVTTQSPFVYSLKYLAYRFVVRDAISRSKKIIVPSKSVREDVLEKFNVPDNKVVVTYEGIPEHFNISIYENRRVLRKYKAKKPYLLYVGSLYPHKNVEALVRALKIIHSPLSTLHSSLNLVIVCGRSIFQERFKKFLEEEGAKDFVKLVGYVPDEDLAVLYKNSEAFIFPTLSEGFGLPGLEAMAYGTPVVCSDIPVLREIYGDAALYFNPHSERDIADKIHKIISDRHARSHLAKLGRERVKKYSWRKMAEETLEVYKEVLTNH